MFDSQAIRLVPCNSLLCCSWPNDSYPFESSGDCLVRFSARALAFAEARKVQDSISGEQSHTATKEELHKAASVRTDVGRGATEWSVTGGALQAT